MNATPEHSPLDLDCEDCGEEISPENGLIVPVDALGAPLTGSGSQRCCPLMQMVTLCKECFETRIEETSNIKTKLN